MQKIQNKLVNYKAGNLLISSSKAELLVYLYKFEKFSIVKEFMLANYKVIIKPLAQISSSYIECKYYKTYKIIAAQFLVII